MDENKPQELKIPAETETTDPVQEEHTNKKSKKNRKKLKLWQWLLIIAGGLVGLFVLVVGGMVLYLRITYADYYADAIRVVPYTERQRVDYAPADYDENIFEDSEYLSQNRDIRYIYGAQSTEVSLDEDGSYYGAGLVFFQKYFNSVIRGECDTYSSFFWDSFFEDDTNFYYPEDGFTMQKIYDISVEYKMGEDVQVSNTETKSYYVVKYRILDNNGTFRPDLDSSTNSTTALLFELTEKNGELRISKMITFIDSK